MAVAEKSGVTAPVILKSKENIALKPLTADDDTLPKQFLMRVRDLGERVAMRKKRLGIWQEYTWRDSYMQVKSLALGMASLGLARGDKVAIIGENDPEFYWAQLAAWCVGATTIAIFTDANAQELGYVIDNSDAVLLFAHDQEQCDKALALREKMPNIRQVIYWNDRGLWNYDDPWLMSFAMLQERGRGYEAAHPGAFEAAVTAGNGDEFAIFSYTSGTTSLPKGAMIRHRNLLYGNQHVNQIAPTFFEDDYVSFSPLAWITEQSMGVTAHLVSGAKVNFPESPATMQIDMREIAPSALLFPSRLWEGLAGLMRLRLLDSTWLNKALFALFLPIRYRIIDMEDAGKTPGPWWGFLGWLAHISVFGPLRDKIGMSRMRNAFTSGAALSPDVLRFFRAVGVELKNLYGSTECQAHTLHYDKNVKLATVGPPAPGVEIAIQPDGEIWIRSRAVFAGYYKDEAKSVEALDADGWFHTGDAGYADADGHLIYLDRMTDMIALANGEKFSPQYIEGRLKFSPYIQDVMAVGGFDMQFVTTIINIDFENVARWAEKNRIAFTTFVDLSQKAEVAALIRKDIQALNVTLPPAAHVKKFVILHKAFDADEAELTRTRKLRRRALEQKYGDMLTAMYSNQDSVTVSAEVKYRDGRTGLVETAVRVSAV